MLVRFAVVGGLLWLLWAPGLAVAAVDGPCTATFNGVDVARIDSLSSPLELDATDTLVFAGVDQTGTQEVSVSLVLGPITIDTGDTAYGPVQEEYAATLDLEDTSPYGVGLYRITGSTDDCTANAWLRVTGRHPMATLTGLTAAGLAVGGLTGQITAIMSRRRLSPLGASIAGVATGLGAALLGQQFGRMQFSFVSLAIVVLITAGIGFLVAWLLRYPDERGSWRRQDEARRGLHRGRRDRSGVAETADATPTAGPAAMNGGPYWCYVMAPVEVFDLNDHTRVIASLQPGTWYLAKRDVSGWVHVVAREGAEGWVAQSAVHRQG